MKYYVLIDGHTNEIEIIDQNSSYEIFWNGTCQKVVYPSGKKNPLSTIIINNKPFDFDWTIRKNIIHLNIQQEIYTAEVSRVLQKNLSKKSLSGKGEEETVTAPMPGLVVSIKVEQAQEVKIGEPLLILEAMKMENELRSPVDGKIDKILVKSGTKVEKGEQLIVLKR